MKSFIRDFNNRVDEINEYFSFVEFIDKVETHKKEKLTSTVNIEFVPKRELQKILRSNCFLLLYNLVESSIRNSILTVYDCVHDESLKFDELSNKLQEIWLSHQSKKVPVTEKSIKKWLKELMNDVSIGYEIKLEKDTINISGNLDYENIQKIIDTYGFFGRITIDKNIIGNNLGKVKIERNSLAHGNKTFCQSGEIITFPELVIIKDNIILFLTELLLNIETYIDDKKYKK
jgi:hypothetical protein